MTIFNSEYNDEFNGDTMMCVCVCVCGIFQILSGAMNLLILS